MAGDHHYASRVEPLRRRYREALRSRVAPGTTIPASHSELRPGCGMRLSNKRGRRRLKHCLGLVLFGTGLYRWFLRGAALVVVFHRIDDRYPSDPLTCSSREFARYCRFFARYFTVVPLGEVVRRLSTGESVGRLLAVTFDDGYRDNCEVAAPILRHHGLSACFFVATGFIGSTHIPWWDADDGIASEWMDWDDVRSVVANGFDVGSHTVHHVDLGAIGGAEAHHELTESKRRLEAEVGRRITLFCYPYGGPAHLSESNRELARQAGYACCLSGFGGLVPRGADPFRIRRTPVSQWYLSPYQFGFEVVLSSARGDHDSGYSSTGCDGPHP